MNRLKTIGVIVVAAGILYLIHQWAPIYPVAMPAVQLPAERLPPLTIAGFTITNTLLGTWLGMALLIIIAFLATRDLEMVPSGLQNAVEWAIEAFYGMVESVAGERAPQFFPLVMTILLFVLVVNWMELIPGVDSIGLLEHPHGEQTAYQVAQKGPVGLLTGKEAESEGFILVPFIRTPSTDLNLTLALALISVITSQIVGLRALGLGYIKKFMNFSGPLDFTIGILESISEVAKIVSFAFRLFGNLFAGQVLLFVTAFLIPYFVPVPFYALEVFVGAVQAFVFAMLTLVFLDMATRHHGGEEH